MCGVMPVGIESSAMAKVTRLPATTERPKDKRRLHLREISEDPHAALDSVGATLRAARLNRGVDPDQVAAALKMRRDHVEAIEDNDFARLPGRTYAIGFVRAYARFVGLDAEVMVQRFKEESAGREHDKTVDLVFPEAPEEKHMANGSLFLIAVVIAAVVCGIWYVSMPDRRPGAASAKAEEPAVVVNEPAAPATQVASADTPSNASVSSLLVQPSSLLADASTPQTASTDASVTNALPPIAPAPAAASITTPPTAPAPAAVSASTTVYGADNAKSRITFKATAPTYILVKDTSGPNGKVTLLDRTLNAGESYRAPDKPGITLVTGNAGGLEVEIDGKKVGPLGKSGEVLNNVPVDASYFLEHIAAQ